jgi:thiol:disulfide interchange protein DsbG
MPDGVHQKSMHHPHRRALLQWIAMGPLLASCSPHDSKLPPELALEPVDTPAQQYAALRKFARGIAFGQPVSEYSVYVVFDPQCLHCARLWQEARPLLANVSFIWVPVKFFDALSAAQAAVLLGASDPLELMDGHEAAILNRAKGIDAPDAISQELQTAIDINTALVNRFRVLAVPYVVARNHTTSQYIRREGVMSREVFQKFLGIGSR